MFTAIVLVAGLAVLYGLAWHNQPVKAGDHDNAMTEKHKP